MSQAKFIKVTTESRIYSAPFVSGGVADKAYQPKGGDIAVRPTGSRAFATGTGKKATLSVSQKDLQEIAQRVLSTWRSAARYELKGGEALEDYMAAMSVEVKNNGVVISLRGWEALSRDLGWAPDPGGLSEGLGKYDGAIHDMKPMILRGARSKVVPMTLIGTKEELTKMYQSHFEQGLIGLPTPKSTILRNAKGKPLTELPGDVPLGAFSKLSERGERIRVPGWGSQGPGLGQAAHRRAAKKAAKAILDEAFDDEAVLRRKRYGLGNRVGGGPHPEDLKFINPKLPSFIEGSGASGAYRQRQERAGRGFTKSLLEGATIISNPSFRKGRDSYRQDVKGFIVYRTVSDGSYTPTPGKGRTAAERLKKKRALAMRKKWLTRGRKGIDLLRRMQLLVLELIRGEVSRLEADRVRQQGQHKESQWFDSYQNVEKMEAILVGKIRGVSF